jgi:hypothetical protein
MHMQRLNVLSVEAIAVFTQGIQSALLPATQIRGAHIKSRFISGLTNSPDYVAFEGGCLQPQGTTYLHRLEVQYFASWLSMSKVEMALIKTK